MSFDKLTYREQKRILGERSERSTIKYLLDESSRIFEVENFNERAVFELEHKWQVKDFHSNGGQYFVISPQNEYEIYNNVKFMNLDDSLMESVTQMRNTNIIVSNNMPIGCGLAFHIDCFSQYRPVITRPEGVFVVVNHEQFW